MMSRSEKGAIELCPFPLLGVLALHSVLKVLCNVLWTDKVSVGNCPPKLLIPILMLIIDWVMCVESSLNVLMGVCLPFNGCSGN